LENCPTPEARTAKSVPSSHSLARESKKSSALDNFNDHPMLVFYSIKTVLKSTIFFLLAIIPSGND
jgi:hypothetical protein